MKVETMLLPNQPAVAESLQKKPNLSTSGQRALQSIIFATESVLRRRQGTLKLQPSPNATPIAVYSEHANVLELSLQDTSTSFGLSDIILSGRGYTPGSHPGAAKSSSPGSSLLNGDGRAPSPARPLVLKPSASQHAASSQLLRRPRGLRPGSPAARVRACRPPSAAPASPAAAIQALLARAGLRFPPAISKLRSIGPRLASYILSSCSSQAQVSAI